MFCEEVKLDQGSDLPDRAQSQWPMKPQLFLICPPQAVRHRLPWLMLQPALLTQTHKSQLLSVVIVNPPARIVWIFPLDLM